MHMDIQGTVLDDELHLGRISLQQLLQQRRNFRGVGTLEVGKFQQSDGSVNRPLTRKLCGSSRLRPIGRDRLATCAGGKKYQQGESRSTGRHTDVAAHPKNRASDVGINTQTLPRAMRSEVQDLAEEVVELRARH